VREQGVALEDGTHRTLLGRPIGKVLAAEQYATLVGQIETGDHAQQRRLSAPGGAEQGEEFPRLDGDADLIDRGEVAETAADVLDLEQRHRGRNRVSLMIAGL
jgi:hypothetical protein